jgi:RNA polymerase sigma factor (sigma-70 family)
LLTKYSDSRIIEGIRRQEDVILKYIYSAYFDMVRDYVLKNSGNQSYVSDVFQETIIILYKQIKADELDLKTDLKGYFFGISKFVWGRILRHKQRFSNIESDVIDETPSGYESSGGAIERIVARAMEKLNPDCREVLNLFIEKVPYDEIARKLGLKDENYARRKKYLCKEALMELVKKDSEYPDYSDSFGN